MRLLSLFLLFATVIFGHSAISTNEQYSELVENNATGKDPNSRCWDLGIGGPSANKLEPPRKRRFRVVRTPRKRISGEWG